MVAELITIFILPIFVRVDLYSIISEMYELIVGVWSLVFIATRSDVALIVPIAFCCAILYKKKCTRRTNSM